MQSWLEFLRLTQYTALAIDDERGRTVRLRVIKVRSSRRSYANYTA